MIYTLHQKGVRFISLDLPYSNDLAVNQLISTNLAAIATLENERRKDRQRQGIQAAKKNGKYFGRKTVIDKKLISQVQDLKENKNLSITEISKITGRARNTIYKILKQELNYIPYNRLVKATKGKTRKLNATILAASPRQFRFFAAPNENFAPNRNWHCNNSSYIWSCNKRSTDL